MSFKFIIINCLYLFLSGYVLAAEEYPVAAISEDMKKGANAIIRYEETSFMQLDLNTATEKVTKVITVFNKMGGDMAAAVIHQSRFFELRDFSGEIFLASGQSFKKIKKADLTTSAYSEHLATDDYVSYYTPSAPSYPYTVKYTYEMRWKNGLASYPPFMPVPDFGCAVEKSILTLQIPALTTIRFKANEWATAPTRSTTGKDSVFTFICENFQAIEREPACPALSFLTPLVLAAPSRFSFDKVSGDMSSWQGVGMFLTQLQDGRTELLPENATKLYDMTITAGDEREKVRILYDYLQNKTRYVSIQLGIGGWQPLAAKQVDATGFGDCKALVNYMKSMLSAVNIHSEYAVIHTDKKRMFRDFSSLAQANHVVLLVPLANDSIWLECTSRDLPFDYRHSEMAGHDVLLVSGEQSRFYTVPEIPDSLHTESNMLSLRLYADASGICEIKQVYKNHEAEPFLKFVLYKSEKERINELSERLFVNKAQITNIQTHFSKSKNLEVSIAYNMQAEKYASQTGTRMFVPLNPFRSYWSRSFSASSRKLPIHIEAVSHRTDSIRIALPKGYVVESMPKAVSLQSKYGSFHSAIESAGNDLILVQEIHMHRGKYAAAEYSEIKAFFKEIDACLAGRLVLKSE